MLESLYVSSIMCIVNTVVIEPIVICIVSYHVVCDREKLYNICLMQCFFSTEQFRKHTHPQSTEIGESACLCICPLQTKTLTGYGVLFGSELHLDPI